MLLQVGAAHLPPATGPPFRGAVPRSQGHGEAAVLLVPQGA